MRRCNVQRPSACRKERDLPSSAVLIPFNYFTRLPYLIAFPFISLPPPALPPSLAGSGLQVMVAVPNQLRADMASPRRGLSTAKQWLQANVVPYAAKGVNFTALAVRTLCLSLCHVASPAVPYSRCHPPADAATCWSRIAGAPQLRWCTLAGKPVPRAPVHCTWTRQPVGLQSLARLWECLSRHRHHGAAFHGCGKCLSLSASHPLMPARPASQAQPLVHPAARCIALWWLDSPALCGAPHCAR